MTASAPAFSEFDGWIFPCPNYQGRLAVISSGFGPRGDRQHNGVDLDFKAITTDPPFTGRGSQFRTKGYFCPPGLHAVAAGPGRVYSARERWDTTKQPGTKLSRGFGVVIDHGRYATFYNHGILGSELVEVGQQVWAGAPLFEIGGSFGNQGPNAFRHIHFELWVGAERIDPAPYLATWKRVDVGYLPTPPTPRTPPTPGGGSTIARVLGGGAKGALADLAARKAGERDQRATRTSPDGNRSNGNVAATITSVALSMMGPIAASMAARRGA